MTAETHRPGRMGRVMVWQNEQPTQVEMTWGLEPVEPGGKPISLLRWEGREISSPCLIIANDFGLKIDGVVKYRAKLVTEAPFFCIAGIWRPAKGSWPASYAALTTDACPDLRALQGPPRRGGPRRGLDRLADAGSPRGRHAAALSERQLKGRGTAQRCAARTADAAGHTGLVRASLTLHLRHKADRSARNDVQSLHHEGERG